MTMYADHHFKTPDDQLEAMRPFYEPGLRSKADSQTLPLFETPDGRLWQIWSIVHCMGRDFPPRDHPHAVYAYPVTLKLPPERPLEEGDIPIRRSKANTRCVVRTSIIVRFACAELLAHERATEGLANEPADLPPPPEPPPRVRIVVRPRGADQRSG